ncbi:hypothetical protein WJX72_002694 [[Myrmecia] bisecta]|uniref:Uncharacterized protein n=1 Tax=[Myrmecia] bisecta TaxID=41462 RepID=A0AAW1P8P7_9CHLO
MDKNARMPIEAKTHMEKAAQVLILLWYLLESVEQDGRLITDLYGVCDTEGSRQDFAAAVAQAEMVEPISEREKREAEILRQKAEQKRRMALQLAREWEQVREELERARQAEREAWQKARELGDHVPQVDEDRFKEFLEPPAVEKELQAGKKEEDILSPPTPEKDAPRSYPLPAKQFIELTTQALPSATELANTNTAVPLPAEAIAAPTLPA